MSRSSFGFVLAGCVLTLLALTNSRTVAAPVCFTASKQYWISPARGGDRSADGWSVKADSFALCVRRQEAAEKSLRMRYPDGRYVLTPAATIGCHAC
jgi:hypothetical protein